MPDPSSPLSRRPLPALPAPGAALLAHLLNALADAVPGALGAALALLPGEGDRGTRCLQRWEPPWIGWWATDRTRVTVPAQGEEPLAVSLVLDRDPVPADADSAAAALPALVLAVGVLREWAGQTERAEQMVQMVQYRRVIEQAKGLVMAATGSDAAAAFATLARASQHFNVRLRNLAVALVELVGGAPAEGAGRSRGRGDSRRAGPQRRPADVGGPELRGAAGGGRGRADGGCGAAHRDRPGWTRRRRGKGWSVPGRRGRADHRPGGPRADRRLVIPPAWKDVWICPDPRGHLQAVGTDAAGRRQYLYHPQWREHRDREKHARVLEFARAAPRGARRGRPRPATAGTDPAPGPGLRVPPARPRVLPRSAVRTTRRERHLRPRHPAPRARDRAPGRQPHVFDYVAKSGLERTLQPVTTRRSSPWSRRCPAPQRRARNCSPTRTTTAPGATSPPRTSTSTSRSISARPSAKDFRTWHATVLAAMALAVSTPTLPSPTARKRAVARAMKEVSAYLGNTPTVAKASYVDPRVVDLFHDGCTIEPALRDIGEGAPDDAPGTQGAVEDAVLELLTGERPRRRTTFLRTAARGPRRPLPDMAGRILSGCRRSWSPLVPSVGVLFLFWIGHQGAPRGRPPRTVRAGQDRGGRAAGESPGGSDGPAAG